MPGFDMTFCQDKDCPMKESCWRHVGIKEAIKYKRPWISQVESFNPRKYKKCKEYISYNEKNYKKK